MSSPEYTYGPSGGLSNEAFLGTGITMLAITAIAVGMRTYASYKQKNLFPEDGTFCQYQSPDRILLTRQNSYPDHCNVGSSCGILAYISIVER